MKISISIIGHNEATHLQELLPTLQWADEIVYVDCESSDDSVNIARRFGCRVFERPNNPNLNVNKSFAMENTSGPWIFYLDPDERIPAALAEEIRATVRSAPAESAFQLNRRNHYFGRWLKHGSQYPDRQLRLFKKGMARFPAQHVHEKLVVSGSIGKLRNDMLHYPYESVSQFLAKFDFYTSFEADFLFRQGTVINFANHLKYLCVKPLTRFTKRYFFKLGFLDGMPGLFAAFFDALNYVVRYFKLWELCQKHEQTID